VNARASRADWAVFVCLAAFVVALVLRAGDSDFTYTDASRHAMDGVFVLDFADELPLGEPFQWSRDYYLTSPALGIGRYPPLMALLEAPFFAALGVRPLAARLASGLVWLAGCLFFYEAARASLGRAAAAFAAGVMAAGPAAVRWSGEVMLELPAVAFLCAGAFFLVNWFEGGRRSHFFAAVAAVCLAGWVKQPAAALLVVVFGCAIARHGPSRPSARHLAAAGAVALVLLGPLAALSIHFGKANILLLSGAGAQFGLFSLRNWLFYLEAIPLYYIGWPAAIFMVAGLAAVVTGRLGGRAWFWVAWGGLFYLAFTLIGYKSARLAMFMLPACAYLCGAGAAALTGGRAARSVPVWIAAAITLASTAALSLLRLPETRQHIAAAAQAALAEKPGRILYSGLSNGTFVFRIRELAGRRRPVVVRADKVFRPAVIQEELGETDRRWEMSEVMKRVSEVAPDVVVVESLVPPTRLRPDPLALLEEYAGSADFRILFRSGPPGGPRASVYRYVGPVEARPVTIPLPGVDMELQLVERH